MGKMVAEKARKSYWFTETMSAPNTQIHKYANTNTHFREMGKGRQGTSSQYQNSYLDLAVSICQLNKISANNETARLSKRGQINKQFQIPRLLLNEDEEPRTGWKSSHHTVKACLKKWCGNSSWWDLFVHEEVAWKVGKGRGTDHFVGGDSDTAWAGSVLAHCGCFELLVDCVIVICMNWASICSKIFSNPSWVEHL